MGKVKVLAGKPGRVEGDAAVFLGLSEHESLLIDLKITTSMAIRRLRTDRKMTQEDLAALTGVDQSRIAKIENSSPRVTLDAKDVNPDTHEFVVNPGKPGSCVSESLKAPGKMVA